MRIEVVRNLAGILDRWHVETDAGDLEGFFFRKSAKAVAEALEAAHHEGQRRAPAVYRIGFWHGLKAGRAAAERKRDVRGRYAKEAA